MVVVVISMRRDGRGNRGHVVSISCARPRRVRVLPHREQKTKPVQYIPQASSTSYSLSPITQIWDYLTVTVPTLVFSFLY